MQFIATTKWLHSQELTKHKQTQTKGRGSGAEPKNRYGSVGHPSFSPKYIIQCMYRMSQKCNQSIFLAQ